MTNYKELAEKIAIKRLITEVYPAGIVSVVCDSFDYWSVLTKTAPALKNDILARKMNALGQAKVVFRPDSGDPVDIITGTAQIFDCGDYEDIEEAKALAKDILVEEEVNSTDHGEMGNSEVSGFFRFQGKIYEATVEIEWNRYDKQYYYHDGDRLVSFKEAVLTPQQKGSVEVLWDTFGGTVTDKGYKTLNERVGLIYGDSITLAREEEILKRLADKGFSAGNIVFGIGSFTYQYITRDTFGMAMKATWGQVAGQGRELEKDPATGDGIKKSAKGLLKIVQEGDDFVMYDQQPAGFGVGDDTRIVFYDGEAFEDTSLAEIREKLKQ